MTIFLSIIAGISFLFAVAESGDNKELAHHMTCICCAAIIAIAIIKVF